MGKVRNVSFAWAISTNTGLLEIWAFDYHFIPHDFCDGNRTALFRTRKMAREYLRRLVGASFTGFHPGAKVVQVEITIREL